MNSATTEKQHTDCETTGNRGFNVMYKVVNEAGLSDHKNGDNTCSLMYSQTYFVGMYMLGCWLMRWSLNGQTEVEDSPQLLCR